MATLLSGTIQTEAEVINHVEPSPTVALGNAQDGSTVVAELVFKNNGNTDQTIGGIVVDSFDNCSLVSAEFPGGLLDKTLTPGEITTLYVTLDIDDFTPGTPDTPFSCNVNWSWS